MAFGPKEAFAEHAISPMPEVVYANTFVKRHRKCVGRIVVVELALREFGGRLSHE